MSRFKLVAFLVAAPMVLATIDLAHRGPAWRPLGEEQLSGSRGADAGTGITSDGNCESINVAQVNLGQNTVGCNDCMPADVAAGNICICCSGQGDDMETRQVDPYADLGGIDPGSGHQVGCGARSAGGCRFLQIWNVAIANCLPAPTGRNCFPVLEYFSQPIAILANPDSGN